MRLAEESLPGPGPDAPEQLVVGRRRVRGQRGHHRFRVRVAVEVGPERREEDRILPVEPRDHVVDGARGPGTGARRGRQDHVEESFQRCTFF